MLLGKITMAFFGNRLLYQVHHLSASHKSVKGANPSLLVPVLQTPPWRGWVGTGTLFHLLRWVTVGGKSQESGCCSGAGNIILINMRAKSHIWHLQWGEDQQVWQYIPDSCGCLSPDFSPYSFTHTHSFLHIHRCTLTTKLRVAFIKWAWNWRAWLAGNSPKSHHGHHDPALARKTMTMARPMIWTRFGLKNTHTRLLLSISAYNI